MPSGVYKRTSEMKTGIHMRGRKLSKKRRMKMKDNLPRNEKHWGWKGDKASYRSVHMWVEKRLGKPHFCENCGNRNLAHRKYHWANVDHKYHRALEDWRRLCAQCHADFDKKSNLSHKGRKTKCVC